MLEGELQAMFVKLAAGSAASRIEVIDGLMAADQPLAALVVAGGLCHRSGYDSHITEVISAVEVKVAAGDLNPVLAGSVAWVALGTPRAVSRLVPAASPLWLGVPGEPAEADQRPVRPDPEATAAWAIMWMGGPRDPNPGRALEYIAWATRGYIIGVTFWRALATNTLDYPFTLAIAVIVARRHHRWGIPFKAVRGFAKVLERARLRQSQPATLVLPPVII